MKLNVRTSDELHAAIDEVLSNSRKLAPHGRLEGVLVFEMVTGGFELLAAAL